MLPSEYYRSSLNVLMISSLMFGTFTSVFAQDGGTPTPSETPTVTPIVTDTPTLLPTVEPPIVPIETPTVEPTIVYAENGLPNLNFSAPDGWEGSVMLSLQTGSKVTGTLTDGEQEYLSFSVLNNGSETPLFFTSCLKVDGEQVQCWDANGLAAGSFFTVEDWLYNADRGAGSHLVEIIVDTNNTVAESDESEITHSPSISHGCLRKCKVNQQDHRSSTMGVQDQTCRGWLPKTQPAPNFRDVMTSVPT